MPRAAQSQTWRAKKAILFVHGVGNASTGDYAPLVAQVEQILGDDARNFALYFLYYDQINDWFANKNQAGAQFEQLVGVIRSRSNVQNAALGNAIAEFAGDVLWPVLLADARTAVREAYLNQLRQIVRDGEHAGVPAPFQEISTIAHSLGCLHTYEALAEAALDPGQGLAPASWGIQFANVIYMASPVQLIRTVADAIAFAVPVRRSLHCLAGPALEAPAEETIDHGRIPSARRTISITGNLDPVGGHFFRDRADWAYMNLPGQESLIDRQQVVNGSLSEELSLANLLSIALHERERPTIAPQNPHDWSAYVARHADDLRTWLTA
jgi:hypothetical protein